MAGIKIGSFWDATMTTTTPSKVPLSGQSTNYETITDTSSPYGIAFIIGLIICFFLAVVLLALVLYWFGLCERSAISLSRDNELTSFYPRGEGMNQDWDRDRAIQEIKEEIRDPDDHIAEELI